MTERQALWFAIFNIRQTKDINLDHACEKERAINRLIKRINQIDKFNEYQKTCRRKRDRKCGE